jgi:hypothetical protein
MTAPAGRWRAYGAFATLAAAVSGLLAAAGWFPTRWLAGEAAVPAMLAGCAIGLLGSLVGGLPVALGSGQRPPGGAPVTPPVFRALAGTGIRLAVAVALAAAAALSGRLAVAPLVAWTAISYLVLLTVDTRYALATVRADARRAGPNEEQAEETGR